MWLSCLSHVTNDHSQCDVSICKYRDNPDQDDTQFLEKESLAFQKLEEIVRNRRRIGALCRVDPQYTTSTLEGHNSVINQFASKNTFYQYESYVARTKMAAIHTTINSQRKKLQDEEGNSQKRLVLSRYSNPSNPPFVPKAVREASSYSYVVTLMKYSVEWTKSGKNAKWRTKHPPKKDHLTDRFNQNRPSTSTSS